MKEGEPQGISDRLKRVPRAVTAVTVLSLAVIASACSTEAEAPQDTISPTPTTIQYEDVLSSLETAYKPVYGELPQEIVVNLEKCKLGRDYPGAFREGSYRSSRINGVCVGEARAVRNLGTDEGRIASDDLKEFTIEVVIPDLVSEGEITQEEIPGWEQIVEEGVSRK